jgi:hypothetical protein
LEGLFVSICIQAVRAMIGVGASVILRGSGTYRHSGGGVQAFFDCTGGVGAHGTLTGEDGSDWCGMKDAINGDKVGFGLKA